MKTRDFCYWLQGYFELVGEDVTTISEDQVQKIKNHLNLCFLHEIDPDNALLADRSVAQAVHDGHLTGGLDGDKHDGVQDQTLADLILDKQIVKLNC